MDVFQILTQGVNFDRKRFADDIALFDPRSNAASASSSAIAAIGNPSTSANGIGHQALPSELDFFGDHKQQRTRSGKGKGSTHNGLDDTNGNLDGLESADRVTKATLPAFLKRYKIKQTGTDPPLPLASWTELESRFNIDKTLLHNLADMQLREPTAVQKGAIPALMDNRDTLVGAPTGSGKTLTYLMPLLHHLKSPKKEEFRAIIVSPTRELAVQIHQQLEKLGKGKKWRFCLMTKSSEGSKLQDPQSRKKYDLLITTPLRLVYAIEKSEVDLSNVRHLILDEADRLLEEGFLEQTDSILAACTHSSLRKALFSATIPAGIEELAKTFMYDEIRVLVGTKDAAVESVSQELLFVSNEDGKLLGLRNLLRQGDLKPPVLLFVQSIERAKELFKELIYDDLHVDVIHSDRPKSQREGVIEAFKKGDIWFLICTEVLARGIDFKDVEVVVNYDFPQSRESYIHRIGRTGRAGRQGKAITFFTRDDATHLRSIVNVMRQSGCDVPQWMLELKKPSQNQKKALKRKAPERQDIKVVSGSTHGRKEANRKREMVQASKRRKEKEAASV